jgi:hypothetical protein
MLDVSQLARRTTTILIAFMIVCSVSAEGQQPAKSISTILVEAREIGECEHNCLSLSSHRTAYCIETDGTTIVGEGKGWPWIAEPDPKSVREGSKSFKLKDGDGLSLRVTIGTKYEGFTSPACRAAVHRPILSEAATHKRPSTIPAAAISGAQVGDYKSDFVWYSCDESTHSDTIECKIWYPNGNSRGTEHYCKLSKSGLEVPALRHFDPSQSTEHNLILASGEELQFDHRERTNDVLLNPSENCR